MYNNTSNNNTVYADWEQGINDALPRTLSIRSKGYRRIIRTIFNRCQGNKILSIGSGTGVFEKELQAVGYSILASDNHLSAVDLCIEKELNTILFDVMKMEYTHTFSPDIIYLDGVLGHLWTPDNLNPLVWQRLANINKSSLLLLSNDISDDAHINWKVTGMPNEHFFRPPKGWFCSDAEHNGWHQVLSTIIPYRRRDAWRQREVLVLATDEQMDRT